MAHGAADRLLLDAMSALWRLGLMSGDGCELVHGDGIDGVGGDRDIEVRQGGCGLPDGHADPRCGDAEQGGQGLLRDGPALRQRADEESVGGREQPGAGAAVMDPVGLCCPL